jgi:hypothetical protein
LNRQDAPEGAFMTVAYPFRDWQANGSKMSESCDRGRSCHYFKRQHIDEWHMASIRLAAAMQS